MARPFVRVSLGGVHDEAEIRGHRRTYIGALPGNIIQAIKKAGARNCVMMLDEIDKMGRGIQGDPSAAMLEVLDPEQNATFRDNYLGVPFDLSRVVFIATANMLDGVPGPLLDRMEIISLAGYTEDEKLEIAQRYLVRRQLEANGLTAEQAEIEPDALRLIIQRLYPRGRRPQSGAGDRQGAAQRRGSDRRRQRQPGRDHRKGHRRCPRPAPVRERGRDAHQRAGSSDRARLDAGRRRHSLHRSHPHAGQGSADPDRPARRRHARERAGGADPGEEPRRSTRHRRRRCSKRAIFTSMSPQAPRRRTGRARASRCSPRSPRC